MPHVGVNGNLYLCLHRVPAFVQNQRDGDTSLTQDVRQSRPDFCLRNHDVYIGSEENVGRHCEDRPLAAVLEWCGEISLSQRETVRNEKATVVSAAQIWLAAETGGTKRKPASENGLMGKEKQLFFGLPRCLTRRKNCAPSSFLAEDVSGVRD